MTDEQVIELAKNCGFDEFIGELDDGTICFYFEAWQDQLLKFARAMHKEGYDQGCLEATGGQ